MVVQRLWVNLDSLLKEHPAHDGLLSAVKKREDRIHAPRPIPTLLSKYAYRRKDLLGLAKLKFAEPENDVLTTVPEEKMELLAFREEGDLSEGEAEALIWLEPIWSFVCHYFDDPRQDLVRTVARERGIRRSAVWAAQVGLWFQFAILAPQECSS